jgi:hypothetical protein
MLNTPENIFNIPFGGVRIILSLLGIVKTITYLCITESVDNPTGGEPEGGRVDSNLLIFFFI